MGGIFHSVVGYEPKPVSLFGRLVGNKDGFTLIDDEVAKASATVEKKLSDYDYFMNVHWMAIDNAVARRLNLQ